MCFLRARAGSSSSTASRRPDRMLVPPLAWMRAMSPRMRCRLAARCRRTTGVALAVEDDHRDLVGGRQRLGGGARRLLGQVHLGAGHRARLVDDQRQRQRRLLAPLGDVEAHGQHRLEARRHVAARAEALRAARDQQPAALRARSCPARASVGSGSSGARHVGQHDQIVAAEVEVARQAAGGADVGGDVLGGRARARTSPTRRACLRGRGRGGSRSVAIASTPSSFSGWRSPPDAVRAHVQRRGPGLGDAHR